MHYALVSDLLTREEFEQRVEEKAESLGGIVDEITAAMLVVEDFGRSHVKIGDIQKRLPPSFLFSEKSYLSKVRGSLPVRVNQRRGLLRLLF